MIQIRELYKSFGNVQVLKGINAEIDDGEIVAIVGASGAGKTTLLQIVGSLDTPDSGEVLYDGCDICKLNGAQLAHFRNNSVGFVFQFHQLLPEFNSVENVALPAMIGGMNRKDAYAKATVLLERLGLQHRATHKPAQLSGGEKQRVAVARALINSPKVILADEPTGSLDSQNRVELAAILRQVRDEFNHTVIVVTHDESLSYGADRILHIADGKIIKNNKINLLADA
ncbi:MAG: ABC transporter ATP-binding protein [Muribaculaceae bacterium]|nr:ABC transporter ATP-binding protein [Muribaculaceae bacterium]